MTLYTVVITATIEAASDEALREMIQNQTPPFILEQCFDMNVEVDMGSARSQEQSDEMCECGRPVHECLKSWDSESQHGDLK